MKFDRSFGRGLLFGTTSVLLLVAGGLNLAVGTWYAWQRDVSIAGTSLTAGVVLLFAATIDRFEFLKGLGMEAKVREVDDKLDRANQLLDKVRTLTELTAEANVEALSRVGRWSDSPGPRDSYQVAQRFRTMLVSNGSDEAAVAKVLRPWVRVFCLDLCRALMAPVDNELLEALRALDKESARHKGPVDKADPAWQARNEHRINLSRFRQAITHGMAELNLEELPGTLLQLGEAALPLTPRSGPAANEKIIAYTPQMRSLIRTLRLDDPEPWIAEIENFRPQ